MERLDIPIVCNLDAIDSGERTAHADSWDLLQASCLGNSEEAEAVVFRYPARAELLEAAGDWIGRESQCCGFFDFDLSLAAGGEEFTIRLGGGSRVKEFIVANVTAGATPTA